MSNLARAIACLLTLTLAACEVGPDYTAPTDPALTTYDAPTSVQSEGPAQRVALGAAIPDAWWGLFKNPVLDQVLRQAIADNYTLAAARATVLQAEESVVQARAAYYPQLSLASSASRQGTGGTIGIGGIISNFYSIGPSVSMPVDLFGLVGRQVEEAQANAENERDQLASAYLTLTGNTVLQAIAIASARIQIDTANDVIRNDQKNADLVRQKFDIGKATKADVLTAESQLTNDRTQLPGLRQQLSIARHALAILVGKAPAEWTAPDFAFEEFSLPGELPVSLPSALVHQRPDILAAEAVLKADSAAIGVATANQYPSINLSASLSQGSEQLGQLFSSASRVWSIGASSSETLYSGDSLPSVKRAAIDAYQAQFATYRQTVLTAFDQVADALHALQEDAQTVALARQALDITTASLTLERGMYNVGKASILDLITAENAYAQAKLTYAKAGVQRLQDSVQLFIAIGGGWWNHEGPL